MIKFATLALAACWIALAVGLARYLHDQPRDECGGRFDVRFERCMP